MPKRNRGACWGGLGSEVRCRLMQVWFETQPFRDGLHVRDTTSNQPPPSSFTKSSTNNTMCCTTQSWKLNTFCCLFLFLSFSPRGEKYIFHQAHSHRQAGSQPWSMVSAWGKKSTHRAACENVKSCSRRTKTLEINSASPNSARWQHKLSKCLTFIAIYYRLLILSLFFHCRNCSGKISLGNFLDSHSIVFHSAGNDARLGSHRASPLLFTTSLWPPESNLIVILITSTAFRIHHLISFAFRRLTLRKRTLINHRTRHEGGRKLLA